MKKAIQMYSEHGQDEFEMLGSIAKKIIGQPKLIYLFCSSQLNFLKLKEAIKTHFSCPVACCSSAGEIFEGNFNEKSISVMAFGGSEYRVLNLFIEDINHLTDSSMIKMKSDIEEYQKKIPKNYKSFATLLIDGLSNKEEIVSALVGNALGSIPFVGGSASDNLKFEKTLIYHDGDFHQNSACLSIISTSRPFKVFKTQHFIPTDTRLVITMAEPDQRLVKEINGRAAAQVYADSLGLDVKDLNSEVFSRHPVIIKIGGQHFVRSLLQVTDAGGIIFHCAIDNGLVIRIAERQNVAEKTRALFKEIEKDIGEIEGTLLFECILRRLDILNTPNESPEVFELYKHYHCAGFHTYGEQYDSVHINQTLTGVALGKAA
jgi:hypothetical protein